MRGPRTSQILASRRSSNCAGDEKSRGWAEQHFYGVAAWRGVEKTARILPALALALASFAAAAAAPDPALKAFLAKFADMAAHGAADSMAKVTSFPLKNRVFQEPERISAAGFKHHFALNSFRELAACLKTTSPQRAGGASADLGDWIVDCNGNIFYFARDGGGWRFTGFENVNE